ncbi:alpha-mannosidase [candidate division KSB1 bacterium]|nr:alpha-mannosidase [candidate division KSB1 bacterium]
MHDGKPEIILPYSIHAIGHAHLDPVWQWTKPEGYHEVFATFRSALDRLNEFPEICFAAGSAQFYHWVAEAAPEMFSEIKARVLEGRWLLVGGWWVEADTNCPSGEALVRQGLYAQRFFRHHFGRIATVGFAPDTFGHSWTLPQILTKQGLTAYIYMRPEPHESEAVPAPLFRWIGADGSIITTIAIISSYNAASSEIKDRIRQTIERFSQTLPHIRDIMLFYGVGNHGGGPTIAAIKEIETLRKTCFPGLCFDSPDRYIEKIQPHLDQLPIVRTELQHHARGCYSACADVKKWDRQTSSALLVAEKIAIMAALTGHADYPHESLRTAWKKVLFNQFHDILTGTSIEQAYIDAAADYGFATSVAQDTMMKSMRAISAAIHTDDDDHPLSSPFIVFNPCSWPVQSYLEFETDLMNPERHDSGTMAWRNSGERPFPKVKIVLRDAIGTAVPYQMMPTAAAKQENQPYRIRLLFRADVPPLGYQVYRLDYSRQQAPLKRAPLKIGATTLENDHVRIRLNKRTGGIISYFNKTLNRELLRAPGTTAVVLEDWDDTWGHRIRAYDRELGCFADAEFHVIEKGAERVRLRVISHWGRSTMVQDFALHRDSAALTCNLSVDWHEKYKVLKLSFPTVLEKGRCTCSIPYGFIERPMSGDEEPGQAWIDVSSGDEKNGFGFAVINDSKCGYSVKDGDIRLTVFHSTAWSHHNPEVVSEQDHPRYMEQGIHEFAYRLIPHSGDWRDARIPHQAEAFLMPLISFPARVHPGRLPGRHSFFTTDLSHVSLSAVKKAEDGDGIILRVVELHGLPAEGSIEIPALKKCFGCAVNPCEIKTCLLPLDPKGEVCEVNLIEEHAEGKSLQT